MAIREMIAMAIGRHSQLVVDWRAIEVLDSSALALIFFSQRLAASEQTIIRHIELPAALNALAELYGVDAFLNP